MPSRHKRFWTALVWSSLVLLSVWVALRHDEVEVGAHRPVEQLYEARQSGVMIESAGRVSRILPDDLEGSRHQRFIVRLQSGHTLLVSHNIDLAPRVANLAPGDEVSFRGQYEWNDRGGVVHWTHHDPDGRRAGGWLRHGGRTYR